MSITAVADTSLETMFAVFMWLSGQGDPRSNMSAFTQSFFEVEEMRYKQVTGL